MRMVDLAGQRFGRLTVIERVPSKKHAKGVRWICQCDCGTKKEIRGSCLTTENTKSCGCLQRENTSTRSLVDITGQRFGKLVAIERIYLENRNGKKAWWNCKCDCGKENIVDGSMLRAGKVNSCGCSKYLDEGEAAFNALYYVYKTSHSRRRQKLGTATPARSVFEISKEDFRRLTKENCVYCGASPSTVKKAGNGNYIYNGLDRIDNDKGYTLGNVLPCCQECNFYKGSKTQEEFIDWIKRVAWQWRRAATRSN